VEDEIRAPVTMLHYRLAVVDDGELTKQRSQTPRRSVTLGLSLANSSINNNWQEE